MKVIVTKTELNSAALKLGLSASAAFEQYGTPNGDGSRVFEFEMLQRIMSAKFQPHTAQSTYSPMATMWNPLKASEIIAARRKICFGDENGIGKCDWNVDGLCQHPDCKTCPGSQKKTGALLVFTEQPFSRCAANKWNFKL